MDEEQKSVRPSVAIRADVATALENSGTKVRTIVVEQLAKAEIDKRTTSVMKVLDKIDEKNKEMRKAEGAGTSSFDAAGVAVGSPVYTKQQVEDMKKIRENIAKLQKALEVAFTTNDFSKVHESANQG